MKRIGLGAASLLAVLAMSGASASAAPVTIGNPLVSPATPSSGSGITATLLDLVVAEPGAQATSPVTGAIVRWSLAASEGGPFRLRVLRPAGGISYTAVGTSASAFAASTTAVETFPTALPIQAGDTIGLDIVKGAKLGITPNPASVIGAIEPILVEGTTDALDVSTAGAEFAFNAVVQPAPTVTKVTPATGSFKGGIKVKITGTDFAGVSAVSFGGVPAKSFTVNSETQLTAVPAAAKNPGPAAIAVTTVAGSATAPGFRLTACKVPKLKTKTLQAAKKALKKGGCKLGKVTRTGGVTAKAGKVTKQGKPAGKKLAPGTKVSVTLG